MYTNSLTWVVAYKCDLLKHVLVKQEKGILQPKIKYCWSLITGFKFEIWIQFEYKFEQVHDSLVEFSHSPTIPVTGDLSTYLAYTPNLHYYCQIIFSSFQVLFFFVCLCDTEFPLKYLLPLWPLTYPHHCGFRRKISLQYSHTSLQKYVKTDEQSFCLSAMH